MTKITMDPRVRFGKPCVKGTRVAVTDILNLISSGYSIDDIPAQYPGISRKDVIAAIEFASKLSDEPTHIFTKNFAAA